MINTRLKADIIAHAKAEHPREACGLLVDIKGVTVYWACKNLADGTDHFIIDPNDYAEADAKGMIVAVVHSHPDAPATPSMADRVACEASGLPWLIVSYPGEQWAHIQPEGYQAPYIGRVWSHGVVDCYSLIRDWYSRERGVILPNFHRADNWWNKGQNLYVDNFAKVGFYRIDESQLRPGDALLMQIQSNVANHAAIYLDGDIILHHLHGRLSGREVYGGYYKKHTTHILRYGDAEKGNFSG